MQCPVIRVTPILFVPVVCVTPLNCVQMGLGAPLKGSGPPRSTIESAVGEPYVYAAAVYVTSPKSPQICLIEQVAFNTKVVLTQLLIGRRVGRAFRCAHVCDTVLAAGFLTAVPTCLVFRFI